MQEKIERWAGLKPAPLTVQVSALTFRPPALYDLSLLLTLIQELYCLILDLDIFVHACCI